MRHYLALDFLSFTKIVPRMFKTELYWIGTVRSQGNICLLGLILLDAKRPFGWRQIDLWYFLSWNKLISSQIVLTLKNSSSCILDDFLEIRITKDVTLTISYFISLDAWQTVCSTGWYDSHCSSKPAALGSYVCCTIRKHFV